MSDLTSLFPGQRVPDLELNLVNDAKWRLSAQKPENYLLVVFYRGLHCPLCKSYLAGLTAMLPDFVSRGVDAIAISTDTEERGKQAHRDWQLGSLPMGYGLSVPNARRWGLYISEGRGKTSVGVEEPRMFAEPGLFLIEPDQKLYFASVQTMPFARPAFGDVLKAIDFILKNDYPPRGQVLDVSAEGKAAE